MMRYIFGVARKKRNGPITTKTKHIITYYFAGGSYASAACGASFDVGGKHKVPIQINSLGFLEKCGHFGASDTPVCKKCAVVVRRKITVAAKELYELVDILIADGHPIDEVSIVAKCNISDEVDKPGDTFVYPKFELEDFLIVQYNGFGNVIMQDHKIKKGAFTFNDQGKEV